MKPNFKISTLALAVSAVIASSSIVAEENGIELITGDKSPSGTFSSNDIKTYETDDIKYQNNADVHLVKKIGTQKWANYEGKIAITGEINVDAAAFAVADDKQIILDNWVENYNVDNNAEIGGETGAIDATGNTQINAAAGDVNTQGNDMSIAVANSDFSQVFGSADAEAFVFQNGEGNRVLQKNIENNASITNMTGSGNVHVNVTAGNFNMQKNALVAAVSSGRMAEATVYDKQELIDNAAINIGWVKTTTGEVTIIPGYDDPFDQRDRDAVVVPGTKNMEYMPVANNAALGGVTFTGNTGLNISAGSNLLQANKVAISHITTTGIIGQ